MIGQNKAELDGKPEKEKREAKREIGDDRKRNLKDTQVLGSCVRKASEMGLREYKLNTEGRNCTPLLPLRFTHSPFYVDILFFRAWLPN